MEDLLHTAIEQTFWILGAVVVVVLILVFIFWQKKKPCYWCGKIIRERDKNGVPRCDNCRNEQLLEEAKKKSREKKCPAHGNTMQTGIIVDVEDVIVYTCPNPECDLIVLHKKDLQKITLMELEFYPAKEVIE